MQINPLRSSPAATNTSQQTTDPDRFLRSEILFEFKKLCISSSDAEKIKEIANKIQKKVLKNNLDLASVAHFKIKLFLCDFSIQESEEIVNSLILASKTGDQQQKTQLPVLGKALGTESACIKEIKEILLKKDKKKIYPLDQLNITSYPIFHPQKGILFHFTQNRMDLINRSILTFSKSQSHKIPDDLIANFFYKIRSQRNFDLIHNYKILFQIILDLIQTQMLSTECQMEFISCFPILWRICPASKHELISLISSMHLVNWKTISIRQLINTLIAGDFIKIFEIDIAVCSFIKKIDSFKIYLNESDIEFFFEKFVLSIFKEKKYYGQEIFFEFIRTFEFISDIDLRAYILKNASAKDKLYRSICSSYFLDFDSIKYLFSLFDFQDQKTIEIFFLKRFNSSKTIFDFIIYSSRITNSQKIIFIKDILNSIKDQDLSEIKDTIFDTFFNGFATSIIQNLLEQEKIFNFLEYFSLKYFFNDFSKNGINFRLNSSIAVFLYSVFNRNINSIKENTLLYYHTLFFIQKNRLKTDQEISKLIYPFVLILNQEKILSCLQEIQITEDELIRLEYAVIPSENFDTVLIFSKEYFEEIISKKPPKCGFNNFIILKKQSNLRYEAANMSEHSTHDSFLKFPIFLAVYDKYQKTKPYEDFFSKLNLNQYQTYFIEAIRRKAHKRDLTSWEDQSNLGSIFANAITIPNLILQTGETVLRDIEPTDDFLQTIYSCFSIENTMQKEKCLCLFSIALIFAKLSGSMFFGKEGDSVIAIRNISISLLKKSSEINKKLDHRKRIIEPEKLKSLKSLLSGFFDPKSAESTEEITQSATFCSDSLSNLMKEHLKLYFPNSYDMLPSEWQ